MTLEVCDMCKKIMNSNRVNVTIIHQDADGYRQYLPTTNTYCQNCFDKIQAFIKDKGNNLEDFYEIL